MYQRLVNESYAKLKKKERFISHTLIVLIVAVVAAATALLFLLVSEF